MIRVMSVKERGIILGRLKLIIHEFIFLECVWTILALIKQNIVNTNILLGCAI